MFKHTKISTHSAQSIPSLSTRFASRYFRKPTLLIDNLASARLAFTCTWGNQAVPPQWRTVGFVLLAHRDTAFRPRYVQPSTSHSLPFVFTPGRSKVHQATSGPTANRFPKLPLSSLCLTCVPPLMVALYQPRFHHAARHDAREWPGWQQRFGSSRPNAQVRGASQQIYDAEPR